MADKMYRQIVVLSGKGGTGKTTLSSALFRILKNRITIDCDVDAANLYLILEPEIRSKVDFSGGKKAHINPQLCNNCGLCESLCRFEAIHDFQVDSLACEGCGFCVRACPENAIEFKPNISGSYFECRLRDNSDFYYARLLPGEGNSGKLVSEIKNKALESASDKIQWIVVDGPPGIGCPVNASLSGADFVVIVTESTVSGLHDMKRLVDLIEIFKIPCGVVINKYDLNERMTKDILEFTVEKNIPIIGEIPFSTEIMKALKNKKTINDINSQLSETLKIIERNIEKSITNAEVL